ncbi:DUF3141 domain-containing protein [Halomonas sp. ND22Bw]|uniref:DUF3141 domain-containing protein n=1 Tax=Halomonas sp. ND22Bw TaxID=2054178 RepID=UPI0034E0A44E
MTTLPPALASWMDPFGFGRAAFDYWRDGLERSTLYLDVMRERGNQYLEHIEKTKPNVLGFDADVLVDGRDLPRPVNYELMRVLPPEGVETDPLMRPFVVVDPRAGHGPGIGGFKPDSELGVALRAGHPCYFIGFLPYPEPGQTVEDVVEAEVAFLRHVISLHTDTAEKPMVVGNCQAGWQIMMAAALEPEVFGPILIAGAPLSYWAGHRGQAPMRYTGGMTGGSWVTSLLSDLGDGLFDGAWLVQNFERLNPANTWWSKQYHLYSRVDTEAERYLDFERWWGGHVVLGGQEIQYIVDNLFVGNRLSTAQMVTADGRRIDLRNLRSPVVVFCSRGDDITPPPQALGWVQDLYEDTDDLVANDQTIVYCVHDTTGHLGIFVSGSVSRKEHAEFTANMDYIDVLPPGLYETAISRAEDRPDAELIERDYLLEFQPRSVAELDREIQHRDDDERRFATVARVSEINQGLYRAFLQPWVKALATPESAHWMRRMHPNRMGYRLLSDRNPLMVPVPVLADRVRRDRHEVGEDNVFRALEGVVSSQITHALEAWRELRDRSLERWFQDVYGQPLLQVLVGLGGDAPVRRHPGAEPEQRRFVQQRRQAMHEKVAEGGSHEAVMRSVIYVLGGAPATDGRNFQRLRASRAELEPDARLADFKHLVREQFFILEQDRELALEAIPTLLEGLAADEIDAHLEHIDHVLAASGELSERAARRFARIRTLFESARPEAPAPSSSPDDTPGEGGSSGSAKPAAAESEAPSASETPAPSASTQVAETPEAPKTSPAARKTSSAKGAPAKNVMAKSASAKSAPSKAATASRASSASKTASSEASGKAEESPAKSGTRRSGTRQAAARRRKSPPSDD